MEKTKLFEARNKKGFSQQYVAKHLCMDVSNYNKREKGKAKISLNEWEKLAKILEVPVEEIYENEESTFIICKDQSVGVVNHGTNNVYTIPASFLEIHKNTSSHSKKRFYS